MLTVATKEWKEYLLAGSNLKGGRVGIAHHAGGLRRAPARRRTASSGSPRRLLLVAWSWVPLMLVAGVVADSFAGERERHTLETLLASRLSDEAILVGKVTAAVGYGWGFTLVMAVVSLVSVNI